MKFWWAIPVTVILALTLVLVSDHDNQSFHLLSARSGLNSQHLNTVGLPYGPSPNPGRDQPTPAPGNYESILADPVIGALIWGSVTAVIATFVFFFIRFYRKHNEHLSYDDHPSSEIWNRGLRDYLRIMRKEEVTEEHKE